MSKKFNFELLNEEDIKKIHLESLKILKEIGIKIPSKKILDILKDNGAIIENENRIAKLPGDLVKKMLKRAVKNKKNIIVLVKKLTILLEVG